MVSANQVTSAQRFTLPTYLCGDVSVYCPEGSYDTTIVPAGYYSVGHDHTTRQSIQACEPGTLVQCVKRIFLGRYSIAGSSTKEAMDSAEAIGVLLVA